MTDGITKLYGNLSNKELAALTFHHLTDANEIELRRIESVVPFKTYRCRDLEYRDRLDGIFNVAALYSIEHWRIYACSLEALVASHVNAGDSQKEQQTLDAMESWQSRLLALDAALKSVCIEHGISEEAIRRLAGAEEIAPVRPRLRADESYEEEMKIFLSRLLPE